MNVMKRIKLAMEQEIGFSQDRENLLSLKLRGDIVYLPFHDDFGPMNLENIFRFCEYMTQQLNLHSPTDLALLAPADPQDLTNHVFLLGSYMMLMADLNLEMVVKGLAPMSPMLTTYRDVSRGPALFHLSVQDCWGGLWRAMQLGWVNFKDGSFCVDEYANFDSPLNADLHEIVPGKLVAMRGPKDLPHGAAWRDVVVDGEFSHRDFSPSHYCEILRQFDVQVVVRLNEPEYDARVFADAGIAVADLFFEDCANPSVDVVAKFLAIVESCEGAVAVHCKAGLGRTGTLIGLALIKHHGFTAREALGWLRIVRPGSVIGGQQDFLCAREGTMQRSAEPLRMHGRVPLGSSVELVQRMVDLTCGFYERRYSAARGLERELLLPLPRGQTEGLEVVSRGRNAAVSEESAHVLAASLRRQQAVLRSFLVGRRPSKVKAGMEVVRRSM